MRGLRKVAAEFALATTAMNLTRMWRRNPPGDWLPLRKRVRNSMIMLGLQIMQQERKDLRGFANSIL